MQFTQEATQAELARFVSAFPTGKAKPAELAQHLKNAIADAKGIRVNEVCFVATDSRLKEASMAAQIAAASMGDQQDQFRKMLNDPQKLLELIAAAEGSKSGTEGGEGGEGPGLGPGWGGGSGAGSGDGSGSGSGSGAGVGTGGAGVGGVGLGSGTLVGAGTGSGTGLGSGSGSVYSGEGINDVLVGSGTGVVAGGDLGKSKGGGAAGGAGSGGGGVGSGGAGFGYGSGKGGAGLGTGSGLGPGLGVGSGKGAGKGGDGIGGPDEEGMFRILRAIATFGSIGTSQNPSATTVEFQDQVSQMPGNAQDTLRQALAGLAEQGKNTKLDESVLVQLAEHLSIKFALEQFERGEVKVNAVRQMLDRMNQEIEQLRKLLGQHEDKMAEAGILTESHREMLDRQFWASVPESAKREVLLSDEAWCIPPKNVQSYVAELIEHGEVAEAISILQNYAKCADSEEPDARKRAATGLSEMADALCAGGPEIAFRSVAAYRIAVERGAGSGSADRW